MPFTGDDKLGPYEILSAIRAGKRCKSRGSRSGGVSGLSPKPSRDGKRFLGVIPEGGEAAGLPMVVVQNWATGLKP